MPPWVRVLCMASLFMQCHPSAALVRGRRLDEVNDIPAFRQPMVNYKDLQYYGNLSIGGQELHAVLDTGSIEFVVLSSKCSYWCGASSRLYDANHSKSYLHGTTSLVLSYGSGQLIATEAYESIAVGPITVDKAPFWEVTDANMPLLFDSDFGAIVGLGPIPKGATVMQPGGRQSRDGQSAALLLKKLRIDRFGVCLGKDPGSAGYFTWNDDNIVKHPGLFQRINIPDTGYWMAELRDVQLGQTMIACENGCGAVVDSGTSLLALPEKSYSDLEAAIYALHPDCTNIATLPDIRFKLDGVPYSLSADAYYGLVYGEVLNSVSRYFTARRASKEVTVKTSNSSDPTCDVALMHITMDSDLGEVWILGTPFFRKYYSVFVQGGPSSSPALYTAPASDECTPAAGSTEKLIEGKKGPQGPRMIDASKVRLPPWVHQASEAGKVERLQERTRRSLAPGESVNLH